ncbi:MAG: CdaR family protein [Thermovirgaceae bacterium]
MIKNLDRLLASRTFLKIVSVIVASLVWYYVAAERDTEVVRTFTLPIEYLNVPQDLSISSETRNVDVQIAAPRDVLSRKSLESIACQVDLKGLDSGIHMRPVRAILPSGVRLIDIKPSNIEVQLTKTATRTLAVEIDVEGGLPPGYRLEDVRLDPKQVQLEGPENKLESIDRVYVQPSLEQLLDGETLTLRPLWKGSREAEDVSVEPLRVTMDYVLIQGVPRKNVRVDVPITGEPHEDYLVQGVSVDPPEVTVKGPIAVLDRIRNLELPSVDVTGLKEDTVFEVRVPPNFGGASEIEPATVRVRVLLSPNLQERMYRKVPIQIRGRSIYPSWRVEPFEADIVVEGLPSVLDRLEDSGPPAELYVDVTNIVSTQLRVPLQYKPVSGDVRVIKVEPAHVTVYANTD